MAIYGDYYGLQVLGALGFVLLLMWIGSKLFHRLSPLNGTFKGKVRDLKIQEILTLDTQNRLLVVAWGNEEHLILVGPRQHLVVAGRPKSVQDTEKEEILTKG